MVYRNCRFDSSLGDLLSVPPLGVGLGVILAIPRLVGFFSQIQTEVVVLAAWFGGWGLIGAGCGAPFQAKGAGGLIGAVMVGSIGLLVIVRSVSSREL